ncbi:MAG TPA: sigma 54-interacting transcriptional regulator [Blastocatellia bacterium]|nr:sigma 54-interacting transcriptional regulator [Blastocatellia bacterium]
MNPKIIVRAGPAKGLVYEVVEPEIAIGRRESNSIDVIDVKDRLVSRNHCKLVRVDDQFLLRDLGSRNGTYVNGLPIKEVLLEHKAEIKIGETWLLFLLHEEDEEAIDSIPVRFLDDDPGTQTMILIQSQGSRYLSPPQQVSSTPSARFEQNYRALLQLGRQISSIRDSHELQQRLLELIFTVIPAERGAILMAEIGAQNFNLRAVKFRDEQQAAAEMIISRTILNRARSEDIGILTFPMGQETLLEHEKSLLASGAKSVMAARLAVGDEVFGVLYLDTTNAADLFDDEHLQLLTAIANIAAGAMETALYLEGLKAEKDRLQSEFDSDHQMIGDSPQFKKVSDVIAKVAPTDSSVLIRGETGTGKELVARAIHQGSRRKNKPFIAINCAALPEQLVESELFGYEKGAFTGATSRKPGRFELANGGTIFLDEIGELKPELQAKLLRVLQEGEFEPLGGTTVKKVNVRLLAATNKDLSAAVREGSFRSDLLYRLDVVTISIPSLRERPEDIQQLANYFVRKYAAKCKRRIKGISTPARACLQRYTWKGNVRELENAIEHAIVMAATDLILPEDLPEKILECEPEIEDENAPTIFDVDVITQPIVAVGVTNFHKAVKEAKKQIIQQAIEQAAGNRVAAAELLGIHPNNFDRLVREFNLRSALKKASVERTSS